MKKIFISCLTIALLMLGGCTYKHNDQIAIGVLAPLSGPGASYGQDVVEVARRFTKKFNETHNDLQIQLIVENGGCNGKDAVSAAQKLITVDEVIAIIGGVCSSETLAAGELAQKAGVMMLAPGSASSKISDIGPYVVRTYNNTLAGETLVSGLDEAYEKVVLITEEKDYPKDMADRFVDAFDGEVVYISYQSADHDFKTLAKQVTQETEAEGLFMFSQSEATSIPLALALADEGVLDQYQGHIYGANNLLVAPFLERMGELAEGMQEVNVASIHIDYTQDEYIQTLEGYDIQGDGFTVLQAADAFKMIIQPILQKGKEKIVTRRMIKDYIYSFNEAQPYKGYLGTYWFDEIGDAVGVDFQMYEVADGKRVIQSGEEQPQEQVLEQHALLEKDRRPTPFSTRVGEIMLPAYMVEGMKKLEKESYADFDRVDERYLNEDINGLENLVSLRILDTSENEFMKAKRAVIESCVAGDVDQCRGVALTPTRSTYFGNMQDVILLEKEGKILGLGYIGSTYQDLPGSIDVQLVFLQPGYLVYLTQTIYGIEDNIWSNGAFDLIDDTSRSTTYKDYFTTFVSDSVYASDIQAILKRMLMTVAIRE